MINVRYLLPVHVFGESAWMMMDGQLPFVPNNDYVLYVGRWNGSPDDGEIGHAIEESVSEVWVRDCHDFVCVVLKGCTLDISDMSLFNKYRIKSIDDAVQHYRNYGFKRCLKAPNPTAANFRNLPYES